MKTLDLSFTEPALNLAGDEVLLEEVDSGEREPTLRFWESSTTFVVVGYGNDLDRECRVLECEKHGIPIFRRASGGGTVLQGPGCLNYSLILKTGRAEETLNIGKTNCHVMETNRDALGQALGQKVEIEGHTDLAIDGVKFSGNAQRRKKNALLFHGTVLLDFDLSLIDRTLRPPSVEPEYREGRPHDQFCRNIPLSADAVKRALRQAWQSTGQAPAIDVAKVQRLAKQKYRDTNWIRRRTNLGQSSE
jgi:lipoate-protein ligase A